MAVPISSPYKELEPVNHISYVFKGGALTDTIELRSSYTAGYLHAGYTCLVGLPLRSRPVRAGLRVHSYHFPAHTAWL